jgi:hypothetical protein
VHGLLEADHTEVLTFQTLNVSCVRLGSQRSYLQRYALPDHKPRNSQKGDSL